MVIINALLFNGMHCLLFCLKGYIDQGCSDLLDVDLEATGVTKMEAALMP